MSNQDEFNKEVDETREELFGTPKACIVTICPTNPRYKRFKCKPGTEYPYQARDWTYCPFCGNEIKIEEAE